MLLGQTAECRRVEVGDAIHRRAGSPQRGGDGLERLPGQAQLAGAVEPRVAGQHLLDQRRSRSRQAEDEHRPTRVVTRIAATRAKNAASNVLQQAVDEPLVVGRHVLALALGQLLAQGVGLAEAFAGAGIVAACVEDMAQAEQEPGARALGQFGIGQALLQRGEVRRRAACRGAASPAGRAGPGSSAATAAPCGRPPRPCPSGPAPR